MKLSPIALFLGLLMLGFIFPCFALQEPHLIMIRQGGSLALTQSGEKAIKQTGEILLTHGFDNRSIIAVYVAPDKGSKECAKLLGDLGLFTKNKIQREPRLSNKSEADLSFIESIEKLDNKGHVILIDDGIQSTKIIAALTKNKLEEYSTHPYIIPLTTLKG